MWQWFIPGLLMFLVLFSAVGTVLSKHQSRKLFVELQVLETGRDDLEIDWGRLQLEQGTRATHGRVERLARDRLRMHIPTPATTVIVRP